MMKLATCVTLSALTLVFSTAVFADASCRDTNGRLYCGSVTLDNLYYLGDVVLDGTTVKGSTKIIGDAKVTNAHLNELYVVGDLKSTNTNIDDSATIIGDVEGNTLHFKADSKITGNTTIHSGLFDGACQMIGNVSLYHSTFQSPLSFEAKNVYFYDVKSVGIHFLTSKHPEYLYVEENSTINGDIDFTSQNGTVYLYKGSHLNGKVTGGKIINN